jgi:cell division protein FtsL
MTKFLGLFFIILVVALILLGLGKQIGTALQAGKRLDTAAEEVDKLQQQNRNLREKLSDAQRYNFIEDIARNKLNMGKPGETVVVIPENALNQVLGAKKAVEEIKLPNWQGWLKLFTH